MTKRSLSPRDLAAAIGVSESSLKRWVDAGRIRVSRTEGGHRRIPLAEAVRFIRASGASVLHPEVLGLGDAAGLGADETGAEDALYRHLLAGRGRAVRGLLLARYLAGEPVAALCDGPVREAMTRLGELWRHDEGGVFVEHRATDLCLQAMSALRATFEPAADAPVAVGAAPTGDPYLLPSLMAATVLAAEGLRVVNLGPDTPVAALRQAVRHHQPALVWLSLSAPQPPDRCDELAAALRDLAADTAVAVGGRHRLELGPIAGVTSMATMAELAARARGLS
jgi:excisionase family DNA binding protein